MSAAAFDEFLSTPAMLGVFGTPALLQAMLDFEVALAAAQADEGLLSRDAAAAVAAACEPDALDVPALLAASRGAGSLAVPFVQQLRARLQQAAPSAAGALHFGSTMAVSSTSWLVLPKCSAPAAEGAAC